MENTRYNFDDRNLIYPFTEGERAQIAKDRKVVDHGVRMNTGEEYILVSGGNGDNLTYTEYSTNAENPHTIIIKKAIDRKGLAKHLD